MGYAWKPPERSDAARRSIESGLHTVRMTLAPGSERDKPLESRKLNRYHGRSFVRARAIWEISVKRLIATEGNELCEDCYESRPLVRVRLR